MEVGKSSVGGMRKPWPLESHVHGDCKAHSHLHDACSWQTHQHYLCRLGEQEDDTSHSLVNLFVKITEICAPARAGHTCKQA